MKDNLILTLSVGENRNYIGLTTPLMKRYSIKTNADFIIIENNNDILKQLTTKYYNVGRANNQAYVLKVRLIHYYLGVYKNILWLDDTCIIKPDTCNLFDLIEDKYILAYNEGLVNDFNSWKYDSNFIKNTMNYKIDTKLYINSGVVLYNQGIRKYLNDDIIDKCSGLFQSKYPHQAYLNYIIQFYNLPVGFLNEIYNKLMIQCDYNDGRSKKPEDINASMILESQDKIYHITGFYINRYEMIQCLCNIIEKS